MAILEDMLKGNPMTALAVGIGTYVLAPVVLPAAAAVVRPVAKTVIKAGVVGYEWTRETVAEIREETEDMTAEARAELGRDLSDRSDGETSKGAGAQGSSRGRSAAARQSRTAQRSRSRS